MLGLGVLLLIVVPIVELAVILRVADVIGLLETILLLMVVSVVGAWLLKQQGTATWKRFNEAMARGEVPTREAIDGVLIIVGGALLLTPGFVTDIVGFVLLFPVTRGLLKGVTRRVAGRWVRRRAPIVRIYDTTAVRRSTEARREEGRADPVLPEAGEDDSPDRG